jgi:hypothetical protein
MADFELSNIKKRVLSGRGNFKMKRKTKDLLVPVRYLFDRKDEVFDLALYEAYFKLCEESNGDFEYSYFLLDFGCKLVSEDDEGNVISQINDIDQIDATYNNGFHVVESTPLTEQEKSKHIRLMLDTTKMVMFLSLIPHYAFSRLQEKYDKSRVTRKGNVITYQNHISPMFWYVNPKQAVDVILQYWTESKIRTFKGVE